MTLRGMVVPQKSEGEQTNRLGLLAWGGWLFAQFASGGWHQPQWLALSAAQLLVMLMVVRQLGCGRETRRFHQYWVASTGMVSVLVGMWAMDGHMTHQTGSLAYLACTWAGLAVFLFNTELWLQAGSPRVIFSALLGAGLAGLGTAALWAPHQAPWSAALTLGAYAGLWAGEGPIPGPTDSLKMLAILVPWAGFLGVTFEGSLPAYLFTLGLGLVVWLVARMAKALWWAAARSGSSTASSTRDPGPRDARSPG